MMDVDRREFLRRAAAGAAAAGAGLVWPVRRALRAAAPPGRRKTRHVVLVAFAGGVRSRDTIGTPGNVPHIERLIEQGTLLPRMETRGAGHFGATYSIFTGCHEDKGIRDMERADHPTLFEYVRKQSGLEARDVWLATSTSNQDIYFSYGKDEAYGAAYGANILSGDGLFNAEFRKVLRAFGKPSLPGEEEERIRERLSRSLSKETLARCLETGLGNDPQTTRRVERFILGELSGRTGRITGPGAADRKAIEIGRNVLRIFKPRLLAIRLSSADIAHGNVNAYFEVIRRNDEGIGRLVGTIEGDEDLRGKTLVVILPEFGRDRDLNKRGGLDHGDGSDDLRKVACLFWGSDVRPGRIVRRRCRITDVCPTLCALFGARAERSEGRVLREVFGS